MTNVLITSAGRRTSLVRAFAEATRGTVVAADIDPLAPALTFADTAVRVPPVSDPGFVDELAAIVRDHEIDLVIPTIDPELPVLAGNADAFSGCLIVVSESRLIDETGDKYKAAKFFDDNGLVSPATWLPAELPANAPRELFVKPRLGSASTGCFAVTSEELEGLLPTVEDPVIQPRLVGAEITVDALFDLEGRMLHSVPRRRIKTLGGESIQGVTLEYTPYAAWIEEVGGVLGQNGALGPVTFQGFDTNDGMVLTEVNPRFGGGVPLTIAAGGNYPAWLLDLAAGKSVTHAGYQEGLYMTRHMEEIFITDTRW